MLVYTACVHNTHLQTHTHVWRRTSYFLEKRPANLLHCHLSLKPHLQLFFKI